MKLNHLSITIATHWCSRCIFLRAWDERYGRLVADAENAALILLGQTAKGTEKRPGLIRPVHVNACAEIGLQGINDKKSRADVRERRFDDVEVLNRDVLDTVGLRVPLAGG